METEQTPPANFAPPNPIRVETALSRYPVHRLARQGNVEIDIREVTPDGEVSIRWEVDYSKKHGQPGPLAYKLDTLIVNRRIEEAPRPIPKLIKLGSLRDICRELGLSEGKNVTTIRKALRQNAFAGITAKTRFRQADGTEQTLEADFTRYSVVFTGEKLPDGRKADAVYVMLNEIYMQVINGAMTRPLDYDYLRSLPPAPQRLYELLSYQMYAALKYDRPRAKLTYSDFCGHAPQTRHTDWERVRSQMNKLHRPHRKSGYIVKVDFQQTTDREGFPDWIMLYQPGPKARAEFKAFTKRGGPTVLEVEPLETPPFGALLEPSELERELIHRGVTPAKAIELVRCHSEEKIRAQIERLDWIAEKKPAKVDDPAAYLVGAIRDDYAAPKGFVSKVERRRREEARQAKDRQAAADRRRKQEEEVEVRRQKELVSGYWDVLTEGQKAEHDAAAIAQADADELKLIEAGPMKRFGMTLLRDKYTRKLLQAEGKLPVAEV